MAQKLVKLSNVTYLLEIQHYLQYGYNRGNSLRGRLDLTCPQKQWEIIWKTKYILLISAIRLMWHVSLCFNCNLANNFSIVLKGSAMYFVHVDFYSLTFTWPGLSDCLTSLVECFDEMGNICWRKIFFYSPQYSRLFCLSDVFRNCEQF